MLLLSVGAVLFAAAATSAYSASAATSRAKSKALTDVTFAIAVNPPDQGQVFAYVPKGAGFFQKNGLNVTFQPNTGGGAALKQLAAGNAQFAISSPENLLNGLAAGEDLRGVATILTHSIYSVGVLKNSKIRNVSQLRGKAVGVSALTSGSYPTAQAALAEKGIDYKVDAKIVVVGNGGPAVNAMLTHQIDAMVTTDTQFAIFKILGAGIRYLPAPAVTKLPGDMILVQTSYLQAHPGTVAAFSRAVMEGTVAALANKKKAINYYVQQYPEVANLYTRGHNQEIMNARLKNMTLIKQQKGRWGWIPISLYQKVQQEDLKLGTITKSADLNTILTNQLSKQIDKFNVSKIQKQAKGK
jgi:NitT/TauT family transport system substrate-binding protein